MDIANLVLDYLRVLNWPLVVLVTAWMFKDPLSELLRKIKRIGFAGGSLDAEADEASSAVDNVSVGDRKRAESVGNASPDSSVDDDDHLGETAPLPASQDAPVTPEPDAFDLPESKPSMEDPSETIGHQQEISDREEADRQRWELRKRLKSLNEGQFYENIRQLSLQSPRVAVREAYQRVRLRARIILREATPEDSIVGVSLADFVARLAQRELISSEAIDAAARIDRIYRSTRNTDSLSPSGALSFVDAVQKLESLLDKSASDIERHARRRRLVSVKSKIDEIISKYGYRDRMTTRVWSTGVVITVNGPVRESESDPTMRDFYRRMRRLASDENSIVRIRHEDDSLVLRP